MVLGTILICQILWQFTTFAIPVVDLVGEEARIFSKLLQENFPIYSFLLAASMGAFGGFSFRYLSRFESNY